MKTYDLLIGAEEITTKKYKYFIKVEDILKKPFLALFLRNKINNVINYLPPYFFSKLSDLFFARCAIASRDEVILSIDNAFLCSKKIKKIDRDLRLAIVNEFRKKLILNKDNLLQVLIKEGHSFNLAKFELDYLINNIITEKGNKFLNDSLLPVEMSNKDFIIKEPYGVFGIITPYNYFLNSY